MPMNPNFLCCIGAELKNSTQQTTRMSQVYLYRSFENETLSDMLSAGFFNAAMGIIRQDDLLLLYSPNETTAKYTYARVSSVSSSGVVITPIGIDASQISVDTTGYSNLSGNNLQEILNNLDTTLTTINNAFVRKDGSSVMTGPLKFRAGSFVGAIAGGLGDGISIYKLKSDDSIDSEVASLTKENGFTPGTTNAQDIGSSSLKWKDLYVARVIASVLNNGANINIPTTAGTMALTSDIKNSTVSVQLDGSAVDSFTLNQSSNKTINIPAANKDLSNLTSTGQNIANWSSNVTNCITEIPQHVNISINASNQLVLASGSTVYLGGSTAVPISTTIKQTATTYTTGKYFITTNPAGTAIEVAGFSSAVSAASNPGTAYIMWFNTTDGKPYINGSDGTAREISFPIAIASFTNGTGWTNVEQVFNGFGYIGSTVFTLPGLEYLMSNDRNADGTLKNTKVKLTVCHFGSVTINANGYMCVSVNSGGDPVFDYVSLWVVQDEEPTPVNYMIWECPERNKIYQYINGAWEGMSRCIIGTAFITSDTISNFNPRQTFRAVDYNDTQYIANMAMPSNRYIEMTPALSNGTTYTAPADGYICVEKNSNAANQYISFIYSGGLYSTGIVQPVSGFNTRIMVPVRKRQSVQINFNLGGTTNKFRFIYAEGVKE